MTYETAKKLKDAGFPQKSKNDLYFVWKWFPSGRGPFTLPHFERVYGNELQGENRIFDPTLSELIEVCGDSLERLEKMKDHWECGVIYYDIEENYIDDSKPRGIGSTPEEAVANLYLELHK